MEIFMSNSEFKEFANSPSMKQDFVQPQPLHFHVQKIRFTSYCIHRIAWYVY